MDFSVLMSLYNNEKPELYHLCLNSILTQSLQPSEIIIIHDGPVNSELLNIEKQFQNKLPITIIPIKINSGLGIALNLGIQRCQYELIIRCDTDDISLPNRFAMQVDYMTQNPKVDISSATIVEYDYDSNVPAGYRKLPETHNKILNFSKYRSPINHMATIYKKSAVISAGNYQDLRFLEDYFLWVRMMLNGAQFSNLPDILVKAKAGTGLITRRGGWRYFKSEHKLFHFMLKNNFITIYNYLASLSLRASVRILPKFFRGQVYRYMLRKTKRSMAHETHT